MLALCEQGSWPAINKALAASLRAQPDDPDLCAMAAHAGLRTGDQHIARFFVHKALGLAPDHIAAHIEDICLDFFAAEFDLAFGKLQRLEIPQGWEAHPVAPISSYLRALFGGEYPQAGPHPVEEVQACLQRGDKLCAMIAARQAELIRPGEADSFAALGLVHIYAGYYENADRNFHEACFRQTRHRALVDKHHFYLFCRQGRYEDALAIGAAIEQAGNLDAHGQGLLLEMMLRSGKPLQEVEARLRQLEPHLQQREIVHPVVEVVRLRLSLLSGAFTASQAIAMLKPQIDRQECPAPYLYLYAQLHMPHHPAVAKQAASRALAIDHLYPDAAQWDDAQQRQSLHFEFAGLFIPREHEGGAWPTATQMLLLRLIFNAKDNAQRKALWNDFATNHSVYTLDAGSYRLLPYIYKLLEGEEIAYANILKGIWKKTYVENALKIKHLIDVTQRLNSAGIHPVLLKGIANAAPLYGDLGSRPMSDVDILIHAPDIEKAHALLHSAGWVTDEKPIADRMRFAYAMTYRHPEGGMLDIHWRPCENFSSDKYDLADLGASETLNLMGQEIAVLSPTLNLFCTILHGVEWNHLSPVRWVADAVLLIRTSEIDWQEIERLAFKYHCSHVIAAGLRFLRQFDGLALPPEDDIPENTQDTLLMRIRLRPRNVLATFEEAWATIEHFRKRFHFGENDHLFVCGGEAPSHVRTECEKRGVHWLPYKDVNQMIARVGTSSRNYNLIVFDANLSCGFQCLNVNLDAGRGDGA